MKTRFTLFLLAWLLLGPALALTAQTVTKVKDINLGEYSDLENLVVVNGTLYFSASDDEHGTELWKSDGTEAGTVLVKDINSGSGGSDPSRLVNVNGTLYFRADDGIAGDELWKSDGTAAGTVLVKDILPGEDGSNPDEPVVVNGTLFFEAQDGINGLELWKSDGTAEGTVLVKDIYPGETNSFPEELIAFNGALYFRANDGLAGDELWKSDGTAAGTVLVKDIRPGEDDSEPGEFAVANGTLYFKADDGTTGQELWKSDGTAVGTGLVKDIRPDGSSAPRQLTPFNGTLYFTASDGTTGTELWKSDGTAAGTGLVKDIRPGEESSDPVQLTPFNGSLYFQAEDGTTGEELWKSDGTAEGTVLVKDIFPGDEDTDSEPDELIVVNGTLYFAANDGSNGTELWKSDGTPEGTVLVEDINPGEGSSEFDDPVVFNGTLFFIAIDGATGEDLWKVESESVQPPLITQQPSPASQSVCEGGSASSTAEAGGAEPLSYQWYRNQPDTDEPVDGQTTATLSLSNVQSDDAGAYYLLVSNEDGQTWSEAFTLSLQAVTISALTLSGAPVCAGQSVTVAFEATCLTGTLMAQLSDAGGSFASPANLGSVSPGSNPLTIPAGTPSGSGYRIRVLSGPEYSGALDTTQTFIVTGLSANFNSTPTVSQTPACAGGSFRVSFTLANAPACSFPLGNQFSAQLSDASGSFASFTDLGTVSPGINTLALPFGLTPGSGYRVRIAATAGGSTVYSNPSAAFAINGPAFASTPTVSGDNKCAGQAVRLSFATTGCAFPAGNAFRVELSDATGNNFVLIPGTVTPGALNQVVIPAGTPAGTGYKLRVVSSNPALNSAASANFKVKACANSREVAPEAGGLRVSVSPNPVDGPLRITIGGAEGQALKVELLNATGHLVRGQTVEQATEAEVLTWDLSRQPQGLYLLRVSGSQESKTVKVMN